MKYIRKAMFRGSESIGKCTVKVLKEFKNKCEVEPFGPLPSKWPYNGRRKFNVEPKELR
jgi:hypothetical protein